MIDVIIAADNEDGELGAYFRMCATDLYNTLSTDGHQHNYSIIELSSDDLTHSKILTTVGSINHNKYIFINFSHGSPTALGKNYAGEAFIDIALGVGHFCSSLFYTFSCAAGMALGPQLINDGCLSFWGYEDEAQVIIEYDIDFMTCTNYGFKMLLQGYDVQTSYDLMMEEFDRKIDYYIDSDFFAASTFSNNKEGLILHGSNTLTLTDLLT
jgi:hypothetical protein